MRPLFRHLCALACLACLVSCGAELNEGESYGNILDTPEGLILIEGEHEIGWGRSECTICHNLDNIHLVNRSTLPIDVDAIHDQTIEDGEPGCPACHGDNGVP